MGTMEVICHPCLLKRRKVESSKTCTDATLLHHGQHKQATYQQISASRISLQEEMGGAIRELDHRKRHGQQAAAQKMTVTATKEPCEVTDEKCLVKP